MVKKIIQIGDPLLLEPSVDIKIGSISSGEIQELAQNILDTTKFHKDSAAGLSAVQIGVPKRMYVVKRTDLNESNGAEEFEVLINPKILKYSKAKGTTWEGCMSISDGKQRLFGPVERSQSVEVQYYNLKGEVKSLNAKDFFSHLIQHEQDHLEGVLFLSYIKNPKNIWSEDELDTYLQQHDEFPDIIN